MTDLLDELKAEKTDEGTLFSSESQAVLFNVHLEHPDVFLDKIAIIKKIKEKIHYIGS